MRDEAEKRIGHLYPKVEVTAAMVEDPTNPRPDLKKYAGQKLTVIAWLWARTVKSPNPASAQVDVPLATTFMLATKVGKEAYVEPVIESGGYRFTVKVGTPRDAEVAKSGTKLSRANFACLMSGTPMSGDLVQLAFVVPLDDLQDNACNMPAGSRSIRFSSTNAGPCGLRSPRSQCLRVATDTPNRATPSRPPACPWRGRWPRSGPV